MEALRRERRGDRAFIRSLHIFAETGRMGARGGWGQDSVITGWILSQSRELLGLSCESKVAAHQIVLL